MTTTEKQAAGTIGWFDLTVDDLDASLQRCTEGGGSLVTGIKDSGDGGRYSVIRDPAGAVLALMEQGTA